MSTLEQHFGGYIQRVRHARGFSVAELADCCALSPGSIRAYEQGRRTPSAVSYKKILKALGVYRESDWVVNDLVWVHPETGQPFDVARDAGFHPKRSQVDGPTLEQLVIELTAEVQELKIILKEALDSLRP